ncbi:hypothetical protein RB599_008931 [Gaeumannomyces hyphopodioides]
MFSESRISPAEVASVTIGTTHFINAVVEMDRSRLAGVAVIRLCGPFSHDIPVGVDWPPALRDIMCAYRGLVPGGLEIDGTLIAELDEKAVRREAVEIRSRGIRSIAIIGIFSPIDVVHRQEERAAAVVREVFPEADVVCSRDVANIGFLERENATVLNASILPFARRTIHAFQDAVARLKLACPVFVTQNDGTILPAAVAALLPIRTFSSGPTNSMRGAAFLMQGERCEETKEAMMVVDIGGTTTDLSVGPESVGYEICEKALVFGGDVPTATDFTVFADPGISDIGNRSLIANNADLASDLGGFKATVKMMLEAIIDTMKTSPAGVPVVLVGGGAVIAPDSLAGASRVVKPNWAGVANAIGAATARVGGVVDLVESTETRSKTEIMEDLSRRAVDKAVEAGALRESVAIAEMESFPLQYIANKSRIIVKAVGDFDYSRASSHPDAPSIVIHGDGIPRESTAEGFANSKGDKRFSTDNMAREASPPLTKEYIASYRPKIVDRQWLLSEADLEFITTGCYILGTGGGGNPYQHFLRLRELLRAGSVLRVISPHDLKDDDIVACGGAKGSPQVSVEKPYGDEMLEAQRELYEYLGVRPTAVIPLEIGGGNGLQGLVIGASGAGLDIPAVDGDWMGRAYPVSWQTTPVVFVREAVMVPTCISDGNGRVLIMKRAPTELDVERALRAALSQMGSHVGCAKGPVSGRSTKEWVVENTMSLAWRIGRAVVLARCANTIDDVAEAIINEVGGPESAKLLFRGKIVGVERTLRMGHAYGEVVIESAASAEGTVTGAKKERMVIPFKNENIYAKTVDVDGNEEIVAIVPDLVCVIDAQNGEALGTQEYRYGLPVTVLGITASERWTSTPRGLEIGGPKGFGFEDLEYKPLGKFTRPRSVIDEYETKGV